MSTHASDRDREAENPNTPPDRLEAIAKQCSGQERWFTRSLVAKNPSTPKDTILRLARDPNGPVRIGVVENPSTPIETLTFLADDENELVVSEVARNARTPATTLRHLWAESCSSDHRIILASNPNTPPDVLSALVTRLPANAAVELEVAANPSTPQDTIAWLAGDEETPMRIAAAGNPSASEEVLRALAEDENGNVRDAVASNLSTPKDVIDTLTHDSYFMVRKSATMNPAFALAPYNDGMDAATQAEMEHEIAHRIAEFDDSVEHEAYDILSKSILRLVLTKFRPDLVEQEGQDLPQGRKI